MTARLRPVDAWLVVAFAAAGVGAMIERSPRTAYAAVALVVLAALLAQIRSLPTTQVFAGTLVLISSLVDLPGRVQAGGFSANAGLTVAYSISGVLILVSWRRSRAHEATKPLWPFVALLTFALVSISWGTPSVPAIQNILVLFVFILCVICGVEIAKTEAIPGRFAAKLFGVGSLVALALYAASVAVGGLGAGSVIGSRSYALFALVSIAWAAAGWRYGARFGRTLTILSGLFILLSLSRTAFAVALAVTCLAWLNPRSIGGWLRLIAAASVAIGIAYLAVSQIPLLHDRVFAGDLRPIGAGISINLEGRSELWSTTWHSYLTSPYLGHGVGTADSLITRAYAIGHPHSDYLRLLHDYGIFGTCLWVVGYGWLVRRSWRAWHRPRIDEGSAQSVDQRRESRVHAAAFLSLIGVALAMVTDNAIVYMFVMGPVGVLVGLSLGLESRLRVTNRDVPLTTVGVSG